MTSSPTAGHTDLEQPDTGKSWGGEPLLNFACPLGTLAKRLPRVERRPFALATIEDIGPTIGRLTGPAQAENPYYDLIVRLSDKQLGIPEMPIGIVSKRYRLVQHADLVDSVVAGLKHAGLSWEPLVTTVHMTESGSRLHVTIHLPQNLRVTIGNDELDLTIECFNSVDRSWALRVGMGWIRYVCGNGLFVGRVTATMRRPHVASLDVDRVPALVATGFEAANVDAADWRARAQVKVGSSALERWVDATVAKKWGVLAGARTIHICRTGYDGDFAIPFEKGPASRRTLVRTTRVPGSEPPNDNVFRLGQILAWLANGPGEWGARLERRRQVPVLLAPLARMVGRQSARV